MPRRVALVTGAGKGIGLAVSERLARDGFSIAFATRALDEDSEEAFNHLASAAEAVWLSGDLADPAAPAQLVTDTQLELGRLDVLVNNAGTTYAAPALDVTAEAIDLVLAVDLRAPLLLATTAARQMEPGSSIVNVTSVHEHVPRPGFAVYAAAKAGLGMATRALALELAPLGIRVNAVSPGVVATERNVEAAGLGATTPLGRPGTPDDVAAAVSFLAGPGAGYITGVSLAVDGGLLQQTVTRSAAQVSGRAAVGRIEAR